MPVLPKMSKHVFALAFFLLAQFLPSSLSAAVISYTNGEDKTAPIVLVGTFTQLEVNGTDTATQSGIISGTGALTKIGGGTLTLTGANTYTGGTDFSSGTLALSGAGTAGTDSDMGLGSGATFDISAASGARSVGGLSGTGNVVLGNNTLTSNVATSTSFSFLGVISGNGGFTKTGDGTLSLEGTNTYTGDTTVSAGTLRIGSGAAGSVAGNIVNNADVLFQRETNYTVSNNISGTGEVIFRSPSSAVASVTGTNTYSGGTTIEQGAIVAITSNAKLGTGDITFSSGTLRLDAIMVFDKNIAFNGAGTINTNGNGAEISGVLSGTGAFTKSGAGMLVLSGINTHTGVTTISQGTLQIGVGGPAPIGFESDIVNNAELVFNVGSSLFYEGDISGTGAVNVSPQLGAIVSFAGSNSYTGGTTVNHGQLSIFESDAVGTGDVTLSDAILSMDNSFALANNIVISHDSTIQTNGWNPIFDGVISGTGQTLTLDILGVGDSFTFNGINTIDGQIIQNGGRLSLGNGNALGTAVYRPQTTAATLQMQADMTVANDILLDIDLSINTNNFDATFSGAIGGTSALFKTGGGQLVLNGVNNYAGATTIQSGELQIGDADHADASIASDVILDAFGTTLSGHGTINGNVTNNSGGTVSPGGSVGTLSVTGNYVQGALSTMAIEVSPTAASKLAVTGNAALDGTLALTLTPGNYTSKTYTILTAGAVTGTFSTITANAESGYRFSSIQYGATAVTIDVTPAAATQSGFHSNTTTASIDSAHQAGDTIFDHLGDVNSGTETQSSNLTFASFADKGLTQEENIQGGLQGLAKSLPQVMKQNGGWFKGIGDITRVDSTAAATGYSSETGGFMFGVDREVEDGLRLGAAGGYEHTSLNATNARNTTAESDVVRFALYGSKALQDGVSVDGQVGYARHMIEADRFEANNGLTASSEHDADEFSIAARVSKKLQVGSYMMKPKAGIGYVHLAEEAYTETGAGIFNTAIDEKDTNSLRLSTGLTVSRPLQTSEGFSFTPEARIHYSYEVLDATSTTSGTLLGSGFTNQAVTPARNMLAIGVGASATLNEMLDAFGHYDMNVPTENTFSHTFSAGVKVKF